MIQWTYENATRCKTLTKVVVATDCDEIAHVIERVGGTVAMTDPDLPTGSDRVAAVAKEYPDMDIIINLQGDEPFIRPQMLNDLVEPYLQGENPEMATLAYSLDSSKINDPGVVKVILDQQGNAIYFSRSPIPYFRVADVKVPVYNHMGLYAYRRDFLLNYTNLPQTPLEKAEALEQLRAIENGYKIRVSITGSKTLEVNTPEELEAAQLFEYID